MPDKDGYPTDNELAIIRTWDILEDGIDSLLEHLKDIWWMANWGFKLTGKRIRRLELHTGGWSGNEDIIAVLRETALWYLYWQKSIRGGHYYFRIEKLKKAKKGGGE